MRVCGECTLCCTLAFVPEFDKREGVTCEHCEGGCRIYDDRPQSCSGYECSWFKGNLPEDMRPDICGVMIEEYPLMVAALLAPNTKLSDLKSNVITVLEDYVSRGLPVIATGQFAKLPHGMSAQEAKDRMVRTIREARA